MSVASVLANKIAVEGAERPLGRLCWYTVPEGVRVDQLELTTAFNVAGVDPRYLPQPIRPVDAFRRATSDAERQRLPVPAEKGVFVNFLVREVARDKDSVTRQVVRETVDGNMKRLSYAVVAELSLDRESGGMETHTWLASPELADVLEQAGWLYEQYRNCYSGDHVRRLIRTILHSMSPTAVRPSGGVYFVPEGYGDELAALSRLATLLNCEFFTVPLVDADDVRQMVHDKFADQVQEAVRSMTKVLREGNPSSKEVANLLDSAKGLLDQVREYEQLLERSLSYLRRDVEVVQTQMLMLVNAA